ncbi:MAG: cation diffusion facilitator family transporter [Promethearchaeia archaeon]
MVGKEAKNNLRELFRYKQTHKKRLILSLTITLTVMVLEIIGGIITNSIALISDAGHMFTHAFAISISLFAIYLTKQPVCHHKTYGLYRAEVLAAFINGLFLLVMVGLIIYEGILRLLNPLEIDSFYMLIIALVGLGVNITSIIILQGSYERDINVKGVFYHMIGDAASSIGIVFVSILIAYTGWWIFDPLVSFVIAGIIIYWAWGILKDSSRILLEIAPKGVNVEMIEQSLKKEFKNVLEAYDTHIWTITPDITVLSTHIRLEEGVDQDEIIARINDFLFDEFAIFETTIQPTHSEEIRSCRMRM